MAATADAVAVSSIARLLRERIGNVPLDDVVDGPSRTYCVCLLAMDQLSVDDRH